MRSLISDDINEHLLRQTGCDIAITHDDSWRFLLKSSSSPDKQGGDTGERVFCVQDGVAFLLPTGGAVKHTMPIAHLHNPAAVPVSTNTEGMQVNPSETKEGEECGCSACLIRGKNCDEGRAGQDGHGICERHDATPDPDSPPVPPSSLSNGDNCHRLVSSASIQDRSPSIKIDSSTALTRTCSTSILLPTIRSSFGPLYTEAIQLDPDETENLVYRIHDISATDSLDVPFAHIFDVYPMLHDQTTGALIDVLVRTENLRATRTLPRLLRDHPDLLKLIEDILSRNLPDKPLEAFWLFERMIKRFQRRPDDHAVLPEATIFHHSLQELLSGRYSKLYSEPYDRPGRRRPLESNVPSKDLPKARGMSLFDVVMSLLNDDIDFVTTSTGKHARVQHLPLSRRVGQSDPSRIALDISAGGLTELYQYNYTNI